MDERLYNSLLAKENSQKYKDMITFRKKLPAYEMRDKIIDLVNKNQVTVISGETGKFITITVEIEFVCFFYC